MVDTNTARQSILIVEYVVFIVEYIHAGSVRTFQKTFNLEMIYNLTLYVTTYTYQQLT